jgi:hypothetical protein
MLKFLKKQANRTRTENGAATYITTESDCLDLFAAIGAIRDESDEKILMRFDRAFAENKDLAVKTLFFARDIRGGLGERGVFRKIIRGMAFDRTASVLKNIWAIPEFGRYDDLLTLLDTPAKDAVIAYIKEQLSADIEALANDKAVSLLGKWLPSVNAHNADTVRFGKMIAKSLKMSEADYRKTLSALRARIAIIENNLRNRDYTFDYGKQPSKAMMKYRKAFLRNDGERYIDFLSKVERGETKINAKTLYPYEIIRPVIDSLCKRGSRLTADERRSLDITWRSQPDFGNGENALVVIDGSGSMYNGCEPMPASVALSLGVYFAERSTGAFHNHFITFSNSPRLVEIKGEDIYEKIKYTVGFGEIANTNIQKVFDLILTTAVKNKLPQSQLPATIYIISDMEFDDCAANADITNFEYAKKLYRHYDYKLPNLVFWNVASRNIQQPVTKNDRGVVLVSGATPRVFAMLEKTEDFSPYAFMEETLGNERYAKISA